MVAQAAIPRFFGVLAQQCSFELPSEILRHFSDTSFPKSIALFGHLAKRQTADAAIPQGGRKVAAGEGFERF